MPRFSKAACILLTLHAATAVADDEPRRSADRARRAYDAAVEDAIAELRERLTALREEFVEEIQTLRTAAEGEGDAGALRKADAALAAESDIIRVEPRRSLWKSQHGFFERLHEGHWIEKIPNGDAKLFAEAGRTAEYVELSGVNTIVRLYEDRCEVRFPSENRPFRKFYDGAWETE